MQPRVLNVPLFFPLLVGGAGSSAFDVASASIIFSLYPARPEGVGAEAFRFSSTVATVCGARSLPTERGSAEIPVGWEKVETDQGVAPLM